jgi:hypothetical protein
MNQTQSGNIVSQGPISIGEWLVAFLLTSIPLLGLIALLVWAFDGNTNPSKSSWAKAMLVWHLISMVIAVFILLIALSLKI